MIFLRVVNLSPVRPHCAQRSRRHCEPVHRRHPNPTFCDGHHSRQALTDGVAALGLVCRAREVRAFAYGTIWNARRASLHTEAHVPLVSRSLRDGGGNAMVGAYLRDLGLGFDAINYLTQTSPNQMEWLTEEKAIKYNIKMEIIGTPLRYHY
jgi:hypothetical protein